MNVLCSKQLLSKIRPIAQKITTRGFKAPIRDIKFLMNDVHEFPKHYKKINAGENATPELVDSILEEVANFSENELYVLSGSADIEGCKYIDEKTTKTPKGYKETYKMYMEAGWQGLSYPENLGGMGCPPSLNVIKGEILATANWTWSMYPGLSAGCINTVIAHGSDYLKNIYLSKLVAGEWTGTMCLTEPQCGSDLGQVKTRAEIIKEGGTNDEPTIYSITGRKIFISCGDHDLTDNIIHCVLARLPGAPEGTRGISLFLVPKNRVDKDGTIGEFNNVNISRIENKMGCHGSSTCEINFDSAQGYLIGDENRGLNHMFTFINTSRLGTAVQGFSAAELSYQLSKEYAKTRLSMRALTGTKNPDGPADPIIEHPDVRKMLLFQKCIAQGGRSMVYQCAKLMDLMDDAKKNGDEKTAKSIEQNLGFLTPILKGFLTEMGCEAASNGIQIFGGHGYIKDNRVEQIYRDVRISALWEGTTQIQGLDLLGRKILLGNGLNKLRNEIVIMFKEILPFIMKGSGLRGSAFTLSKGYIKWNSLAVRLGILAYNNRDIVGSASVDFLMFSGYTLLGHHLLKMGYAAHLKLLKENNTLSEDDRIYYNSKIELCNFYFSRIYPRIHTLSKTMLESSHTIMMNKKEYFD